MNIPIPFHYTLRLFHISCYVNRTVINLLTYWWGKSRFTVFVLFVLFFIQINSVSCIHNYKPAFATHSVYDCVDSQDKFLLWSYLVKGVSWAFDMY